MNPVMIKAAAPCVQVTVELKIRLIAMKTESLILLQTIWRGSGGVEKKSSDFCGL